VLIGAAAGLAAGVAAWLLSGGPQAAAGQLAPLEAGSKILRAPRIVGAPPRALDVAGLAAEPIFQLTTGPSAIPAPVLRLDGLARTRARLAALLSIDGKAPEWLGLGESRDGIILLAVQAAKVVVDTAYGPVDVVLGKAPNSPAAASLPDEAMTPMARPDAPPGFRLPPPPASAPRRP
jgi:hypothetical protein